MNEITRITDENNNENKTLIDNFDSEPGYYYQVIRPMLTPGHETELIYWLKNFGLIPNTQICNNTKVDEACNKIMEWIPVKTIDYYQWKCKNCSEKKSIRENSVFQDVRCNLKNSVRILLGWCKGYDVDTMANILERKNRGQNVTLDSSRSYRFHAFLKDLESVQSDVLSAFFSLPIVHSGIKKRIVNVLYDAVTATAKKHLQNHVPNKQLGGPGIIVIIDTYPEGCTNSSRPIRGNRPILCIAEVKLQNIPPNYWFEALNRFNRNNLEQIKSVKDYNLKIIQEIVMPGSILVTRLDSLLCSYDDLQCLKHLYPTIVSVEGLARHDCDNQTIFGNLETIWKVALDVCEEAQFFNYHQVPNFLISYMWQARFGNEAFEMLLHRLADLQ